jgi:chitinase
MTITLRIVAAVLLCLAFAPLSFARVPSKKAIVAYVFVKDAVLGPNDVAAGSLTRVNYAFANIEHGKIVEGFAHDRENFQVLHNLKQVNPNLQIVVSVGGWTWSGAFSDMVLTAASRKTFIDSAVQFVRDHQLDGLDVDWEYPGSIGNGNVFRPEDKQNYTLFLKELRSRFDLEGKRLGRHLVTSIAVGASAEFISHTEMSKVQRYVDSVNLMSYDYYESSSDATTGHHAPLYTNPADPKHVSADASVKLFEQAGVPAHKLILGVPFYGRAWADAGDTNHGLYQPGKKATVWATYRDIAGTFLSSGFVRYWDAVSSAPYLYNPATHMFVSYEDPESIAAKCQYVLKKDLGGIMFWDYLSDTADHALLNSIHRGLASEPGSQTANADGKD